jgi:hypothetical protein
MASITVQVWDMDADEVREVTVAEAAAGMVRYARSLRPGTAACGEVERKALDLLRGSGEMAAAFNFYDPA